MVVGQKFYLSVRGTSGRIEVFPHCAGECGDQIKVLPHYEGVYGKWVEVLPLFYTSMCVC